MLVALMTAAGAAYIATDAVDAPGAFGDQRQLAELRGKPAAPDPAAAVDGAALYAARCAACHQASGAGVPGAFPPLAGSEWVAGDAARLVAIVLHGLTGPITVMGAAYNGAMPAFGAQLTDGEIAAVLSHVRKQWGGADAAAVEVAAASRVRAATQDRSRPFNGAAELAAALPSR
jgi:mono/diheme cytochrome c family protein